VANEVDELNGVTENIIVGQPIQLGTGDVKLIARSINQE
jgi:DNA-directed RNA polymerase subunit A"